MDTYQEVILLVLRNFQVQNGNINEGVISNLKEIEIAGLAFKTF
jgi:hypothetical protein